MGAGDENRNGSSASAARGQAALRFDCISCGEEISPPLANLGSVTCHSCRPGVRPGAASQRLVAAVDTADVAENLAELRRELHRCRRYRRTLAVLGMPLLSVERQEVLGSSLRVLDTAWSDGSQLYVLLPESGREGADAMVARLGEGEDPVLDVAVTRIAVFPDDAMTLGALIAAVSVSQEKALQRPDGAEAGTTGRSSRGRLATWLSPPSPGRGRGRRRPTVPSIARGRASYDAPASLTRSRLTGG